ncbi:prolamin-like domain-containing protein [Tanacetum coccineum]
MVFKHRLLLLTYCLVSLISQGLARRSPPVTTMPSKTFLQCYSAMFDLGYCTGEILRARRGQVSSNMRPTCCKAAKRISSACWLILFPLNPFLHQLSCSLSMADPPPVTNKPISDSQAPVAPGPDALPPSAPSPMVEGSFANSPDDEEAIE